MKTSLWPRLALIALLGIIRPLAAQQPPTPDQAKRLLETRPDLVAALRREIATSGMTPEQIRAQLRAAGYPDSMLDAYFGSQAQDATSDSTALSMAGVLDAASALGLMESKDSLDLRGLGRDNTLSLPRGRRGFRSAVDAAAARAEADSGLTIFGLNVFNGATTQFDPNLAGPVDANYRLGPGDRLVLIITGDAERALTLDVTREGLIVVPGVGEIPAANLTLAQLEDQLYVKLGRVYSGLTRAAGATTHFSLNVARLHSNQVYVLGDVVEPGSYRISSTGTALTALYAAGGPTPNGGMRRVEIRRAGALVDTLDLYDYLLRADGSHDPRLQSGDVVFVPVHGARVRLVGEVVRPATYEIRHGESLADLLVAAGGFTADASRQRVQVERILPPNQRDTSERARVVIDVAASEPNPEAAPAFPLEPGDVVRVFRVSERVGRRIAVLGDVGTPGNVGFTTGMRLSDALRVAGGIKPDAYLGHVLISRLRGSDSARVQLRAALRDSTGRPVIDTPLREDDEIRVFSVTELRDSEYVAVTGAVRHPGRYPYRDGITLRDLVLLAGGLDERASVREAEIARLPAVRESGQLAVSQRVSLDSSYLVASQARRATTAQPGLDVVQAGAVSEVALQPFDNVLILSQPDWVQPRRVVITGEIGSPGAYTLLTKNDRLRDLLDRAGGLTNAAYVDGIVFYRHEGNLGRVGVNLPTVLRDPKSRDNLLLTDGDSIDLPRFNGLVEVQGAVNAPRGIAWVPGAGLDYYVRAAGGGKKTADLGHSYVTQPDGNVETVHARRFLPDGIPEPRPGSVVQVTEHDAEAKIDPIARLSVIAQIVGSLVAIVAITRRP